MVNPPKELELEELNKLDTATPGKGVNLPLVEIEEEKNKEVIHKEKTISPKVYLSSPSVRNQRERYPESVHESHYQHFILDLSKAEDRNKYDELASHTINPDSNCMIAYEDIKFSEDTHNWKVFLRVVYLKFDKITPDV